MRFTETRIILSCDRCDTRIDEQERPSGWMVANTSLSEAPLAIVEYHLCPSCRESLGIWVAAPKEDRALVERLADILYPMDEYADTQWEGGDVCDALATLLMDVAPWAKDRQPEGPDDAFEAYRRERERLGL